jgi:FkbM family methyltransferase
VKTLTETLDSEAERQHAEGVKLYQAGRFEEAARALEASFREQPNTELANDWAAAELASGRIASAERGFMEALRLDPGNADAAANLGALLAGQGRAKEAVPILELAVMRSQPAQRPILEPMLGACRAKATADAVNEAVANLERFVTTLKSWRPEAAPAVRPPVYMGNNRALLCTRHHCKMYVDTTDLLIAPWLLMHGEWEPEETALVQRLLKPGDVFADVGANIGYYTLLAVRLGASQVYAFEPQASNYELLSKNVIINWMTSVVRCEKLAAFSHSTEVEFFARKNYPGNSSIGVSPPEQLAKWFDTAERTTLRAVSLDDYFSDKPGRVNLLKVDVEGAEPAAFEGMRLLLSRNRDIQILCEWSPDQMATARQDPEKLVQLWREMGLRAFVLHTGLKESGWDELLRSGYQNLLLHR